MKIQKNKSKASIIIVNYNNAKFLTKSITSALNQSYKKKEVIGDFKNVFWIVLSPPNTGLWKVYKIKPRKEDVCPDTLCK